MKAFYILLPVLSAIAPLRAATVVDFDDLSLPTDSFHNNGAFTSVGAGFNNAYSSTFGSWGGFSYSNTTDKEKGDYTNQYSAITGKDGGGIVGGNYAVGYMDTFTPAIPTVTLPPGLDIPVSMQVTNTTYAYFAMFKGNDFARKFEQGDYFKLSISGYLADDTVSGSMDFFLADFRSSDPANHYILNQWTSVDLTTLGSGVDHLVFTLDSTDSGAFGLNTPAYFALDDLVLVPEPVTWMLLLASGGVLWLGSVVRRKYRKM